MAARGASIDLDMLPEAQVKAIIDIVDSHCSSLAADMAAARTAATESRRASAICESRFQLIFSYRDLYEGIAIHRAIALAIKNTDRNIAHIQQALNAVDDMREFNTRRIANAPEFAAMARMAANVSTRAQLIEEQQRLTVARQWYCDGAETWQSWDDAVAAYEAPIIGLDLATAKLRAAEKLVTNASLAVTL